MRPSDHANHAVLMMMLMQYLHYLPTASDTTREAEPDGNNTLAPLSSRGSPPPPPPTNQAEPRPRPPAPASNPGVGVGSLEAGGANRGWDSWRRGDVGAYTSPLQHPKPHHLFKKNVPVFSESWDIAIRSHTLSSWGSLPDGFIWLAVSLPSPSAFISWWFFRFSLPGRRGNIGSRILRWKTKGR